MNLSDILITIIFLISLLSILTFNSGIILFSMIFTFWVIVLYILDEHIPRMLAKLGKCPYCNSKSVKFSGWYWPGLISPRGIIESNFMTGNFRIACEKCKKIHTANLKIRFIYFLLFVTGLISPIYIYGFIVIESTAGIFTIDIIKLSKILLPLIALILIHVYFRLNKKLY